MIIYLFACAPLKELPLSAWRPWPEAPGLVRKAANST